MRSSFPPISPRPLTPVWSGNRLVFDGLKGGEQITIQFPLRIRRGAYTIAGKRYEVTFKGNSVIRIDPKDPDPKSYFMVTNGTTCMDASQAWRFDIFPNGSIKLNK